MQTQDKLKGTEGSALILSLFLAGIVIISAGSSVRLVLNEYRMAKFNTAWTRSLHSSETGVEIAMNAFHRELLASGSGWGDSLWTNVGNKFMMTNYALLTASGNANLKAWYCVEVETNLTNTITAKGVTVTPVIGAEISTNVRTIQVLLVPEYFKPFEFGLVSKGKTYVKAGPLDSFDSGEGLYSTGPTYKNCSVVSTGTWADVVELDTYLYGSAYCGVGGNPATAVNAGAGLSGTKSGGADYDFPDVVVPCSTNWTTSLTTATVLSAPGDYAFGSISDKLSFTNTGNVRIYIDGDFKVVGGDYAVDVPAGVTVEIYCNGAIQFNKGVNSQVSPPSSLRIYGTKNCKDVKYSGNAFYDNVVFYTPEAVWQVTGQAKLCGSIVAKEIDLGSNNAEFHYDESLGKLTESKPRDYEVIRWVEL